MGALEWIADRVLGWLVVASLVLAGVGVGVGIYEHEWFLCALGAGFACVAWFFVWLDERGV